MDSRPVMELPFALLAQRNRHLSVDWPAFLPRSGVDVPRHPLPPSARRLLAYIATHPGRTSAAAVRAGYGTRNNTTSAARRLEACGYITRTHNTRGGHDLTAPAAGRTALLKMDAP